MRIKVEFETANSELPLDYRRKFISYLKKSFEEYNHDLFITLYGTGHSPKPFCFSVYFLPEVTINRHGIDLKSKQFSVYFTTQDVLMGVHIVNALLARRNRWFPLANCNNKLKALSLTKVQERSIMSNTVLFKILSPIIIRDHSEKEGKDWYLTYEDEDFEGVWKRNLKTELQNIFGRDVSGDIDALRIKPINLKKTVVVNYGVYVPCTIGELILEGEKYLLEYLYKAGAGSKRSMGFGCLDVV